MVQFLKGSQTSELINNGVRMFEYGAILKGSQTMLQAYALFHAFEYCAILKGSQTIGSGGCIIARKSEFFAFCDSGLKFSSFWCILLVESVPRSALGVCWGVLLSNGVARVPFIWIFLFESVCSAKCALISSLTCNALPCPTSE